MTSGPDQDVTVPPTRPDALDGQATAENATRVAQYFVQLLPYVMATGDTSAWEALSGPDCKFCASARDLAMELATKDQRITGGAIDVGFGHATAAEGNVFSASVEFVEHPSQRLAADGSVLKDDPDASAMRANLEVRWEAGAWTIQAVWTDDLGPAL